jgi:uncharacterized protein (DUF1684 family)
MVDTDTQLTAYKTEIAEWQKLMSDRLRAEDGWLTLVGLYWLHEGVNTVGSDPAADVILPSSAVPAQLGTMTVSDGQITLDVSASVAVTVDGVETNSASLRPGSATGEPSVVRIGTVTFFVLSRDNTYAVRVRDTNNPDRLAFTERRWFPIDTDYGVRGTFVPYDEPRYLDVMNSAGFTEPMQNPGRVTFELGGEALSLEGFAAGEGQLWFIFKDATNGKSTYGAGRFMYAPLTEDGAVTLDFNKAYHPPCAFTPYATCPLPPKDNVLSVAVEAGEHD